MVYIDTSVLAAYYCPESLSDQGEAILLNTEEPAISHLAEVEFRSALARKIREQILTTGDGNRVYAVFQTHIRQNSYTHLRIEPRHYSIARDWISQFRTPLRTLDALHLAIASENSISVLTADNGLASAAALLSIEATLVS